MNSEIKNEGWYFNFSFPVASTMHEHWKVFSCLFASFFFSPLLPDTPPLPDVMETRSDSER